MLNWNISIPEKFLKLFNCMQLELFMFNSNTWIYLKVRKQMGSGSFKNVTYKLFKKKVIYK